MTLSTSLVPWTGTQSVGAPRGLTVITASDLTMSEDGKTATYTLDGHEFPVIISHSSWTVAELIESVKLAGVDDDLNPWVQFPAFEAGIRVEF